MALKRNLSHPLSCSVCGVEFFPWSGRETTSKVCSAKCVGALHRSSVPDLETRLKANIKIVRGCWIWQGAKNANGYGLVKVDRKGIPRRAHRVSFETFKSCKLSSDQYVCHSCDTRDCINPDHLFLGDPRINSEDAKSKGRLIRRAGSASFGERHPKTFLSADDVIAIRSATDPVREIAKNFGTHVNTIRGIRSRRTWKHI